VCGAVWRVREDAYRSGCASCLREENKMKELVLSIKKFFTPKSPKLEEITYPKEILVNKWEAYKKAWEARDFEIRNYWVRTAYFWAFQVASFTGYFAVLAKSTNQENCEIVYCVNCIGFITALAWALINEGSKKWQKNWEDHIDVLEDDITGPLYKTISMNSNYSVSTINKMISIFFTIIWLILGVNYFCDNITIKNTGRPAWIVIILTILVLCFSFIMIFGGGKTNYVHEKTVFYKIQTKDELCQKKSKKLKANDVAPFGE
jgi:hypothetical protein